MSAKGKKPQTGAASADPMESVASIRRQIKVEGLSAAYDALVSVCRDPKAPAPAKATAAIALFRGGGVFESMNDDLDQKEPHEMTAQELERAARRALDDLGRVVPFQD